MVHLHLLSVKQGPRIILASLMTIFYLDEQPILCIRHTATIEEKWPTKIYESDES